MFCFSWPTGADAYRWSGANRWNHADTDAFGRLGLWEQHTVGRMYVYDSTFSRLQSSGQLGVNDLASLTKAQCNGTDGRTRMLCFDFIMAGYYGSGNLAGFRSAMLYDPNDAEATALNETIRGWTAFYRRYSNPRPSGERGVLVTDLIHLRRTTSRSIEATLSATADASAPERAIITVVNPTLELLSTNISAPLYYAGLAPGHKVRLEVLNPGWKGAHGGLANVVKPTHTVGEGSSLYDIAIPVSLKPSSYAIFLVSVVAG